MTRYVVAAFMLLGLGRMGLAAPADPPAPKPTAQRKQTQAPAKLRPPARAADKAICSEDCGEPAPRKPALEQPANAAARQAR